MLGLKNNERVSWLIFLVLALIGTLMFSMINCDSLFGTNEANIIVFNTNYDETLDIYMDGDFQFSLDSGTQATISDVSFETHYLEAKETDTDTIIASTTIIVESKIDYTWTI